MADARKQTTAVESRMHVGLSWIRVLDGAYVNELPHHNTLILRCDLARGAVMSTTARNAEKIGMCLCALMCRTRIPRRHEGAAMEQRQHAQRQPSTKSGMTSEWSPLDRVPNSRHLAYASLRTQHVRPHINMILMISRECAGCDRVPTTPPHTRRNTQQWSS